MQTRKRAAEKKEQKKRSSKKSKLTQEKILYTADVQSLEIPLHKTTKFTQPKSCMAIRYCENVRFVSHSQQEIKAHFFRRKSKRMNCNFQNEQLEISVIYVANSKKTQCFSCPASDQSKCSLQKSQIESIIVRINNQI